MLQHWSVLKTLFWVSSDWKRSQAEQWRKLFQIFLVVAVTTVLNQFTRLAWLLLWTLGRHVCELRPESRGILLLCDACVHWVNPKRKNTACLLLRPRRQPGDRLCVATLCCYVCCYGCCVSEKRINVSAVPMAPYVFFHLQLAPCLPRIQQTAQTVWTVKQLVLQTVISNTIMLYKFRGYNIVFLLLNTLQHAHDPKFSFHQSPYKWPPESIHFLLPPTLPCFVTLLCALYLCVCFCMV